MTSKVSIQKQVIRITFTNPQITHTYIEQYVPLKIYFKISAYIIF